MESDYTFNYYFEWSPLEVPEPYIIRLSRGVYTPHSFYERKGTNMPTVQKAEEIRNELEILTRKADRLKKQLESSPEKRHITFKMWNDPARPSQMKFQITGQSHREYAFTPDGKEFRASNGYNLRSVAHPEVWETHTLFVRGDDTQEDNLDLEMPINVAKKVVQAIAEYNEEFKG